MLFSTKYAVSRQIQPRIVSYLLVEAKGTCALFLFLLAAKKKAVIVSFR